jgi:hypothetical protein
MRLYSGSETIQLVSVWALRHLSISSQVAPLLITAQGIPDVVFALLEFPGNSLLLEQGCHLLLNLATLEAGVQALCSAEVIDSEGGGGRAIEQGAAGAGIKVLLTTMEDHIKERKIVEPTLALLRKMLKYSKYYPAS